MKLTKIAENVKDFIPNDVFFGGVFLLSYFLTSCIPSVIAIVIGVNAMERKLFDEIISRQEANALEQERRQKAAEITERKRAVLFDTKTPHHRIILQQIADAYATLKNPQYNVYLYPPGATPGMLHLNIYKKSLMQRIFHKSADPKKVLRPWCGGILLLPDKKNKDHFKISKDNYLEASIHYDDQESFLTTVNSCLEKILPKEELEALRNIRINIPEPKKTNIVSIANNDLG